MSSAILEDKSCTITFYTHANSTIVKVVKIDDMKYLFTYNNLQSETIPNFPSAVYRLNQGISSCNRIRIDLFSPYPSVDFSVQDFMGMKQPFEFYLRFLG